MFAFFCAWKESVQYVFFYSSLFFFNVYVFNYLVSVPLNYSVCSHLLLPFLVIVLEELGRNQIPTEVRSHKFGLFFSLPLAVRCPAAYFIKSFRFAVCACQSFFFLCLKNSYFFQGELLTFPHSIAI